MGKPAENIMSHYKSVTFPRLEYHSVYSSSEKIHQNSVAIQRKMIKMT